MGLQNTSLDFTANRISRLGISQAKKKLFHFCFWEFTRREGRAAPARLNKIENSEGSGSCQRESERGSLRVSGSRRNDAVRDHRGDRRRPA